MKMSCALALVAGGALSGCGGGGDRPVASAAPDVTNWRSVATPADRNRLRDWRAAWMTALTKARKGGAGKSIASLGPLLDPDRALATPVPPSGNYRCRVIKLGSQGTGPEYVAYPAFGCRIDTDGGMVEFRKTGGSQRQVGNIYPGNSARAVFLGTLVLSDEARAMDYGMDASRDMAGFVERVGDDRWRLVLPYPRFESILDVVEITAVG